MSRRHPLPASLAGRPFTRTEALREGVSLQRLDASDLVRPFHGVRAPATGDASSVIARCAAYGVRMTETSAFSHSTAAALWGMPLPRRVERDAAVHVTVWEGKHRPRERGVVGHRARHRPVITSVGALRVVAPADAWCQLGAALGVRELVVAAEHLVGWPRPVCALDEIDSALARFGSRRGIEALRGARALVRERSASPRETLLRLDLVDAGLPEPELNGEIETPDGSTHGDLVFRRWRVIAEYDGDQHRLDDRQWATDVSRLNALAAAGWIVVRVTRHMPVRERVRAVARALNSRGWRT